tara:strand:+ start:374 stop:544 length:171 start_codon:yes stop_codon:yes gene_type:complete
MSSVEMKIFKHIYRHIYKLKNMEQQNRQLQSNILKKNGGAFKLMGYLENMFDLMEG